MRKVIRDGAIVLDDWRHLEDSEPAPAAGRVIVSLERWLREKALLQARGPSTVGVRLAPDQTPEALAADLPELALIALEFPVFRDGRSLSLARVLREQLGFCGELRAVGDVLRDQMFYMHRVGINAFEPRADRCIEQALAALSDFSRVYQPAADDHPPVWRRRQAPSS